MKSLMLIALLSLFSCSGFNFTRADTKVDTKPDENTTKKNNDPLNHDTFSFEPPAESDISTKLTLWATYYYLPQIQEGSGEYPFRDLKNLELGPRVTLKEWCDSAMEGSVQVTLKTGDIKTYNYIGSSLDNPVDCSSIFNFDVSKSKFGEARGPYGDGLKEFILVPYRTLATDNTAIAPGSVLYIPAAKNAVIMLPDGRKIIHDGYFFVGDKGGAIKGNHIDVYIGVNKTAPFFPWIKNSSAQTFEADVISDQKIISSLYALHAGK